MNTLIIKNMRSHHSSMNNKTSQDKNKKANLDRQLTIMLLLVTFALLCLTGPQYIRYLVYTLVDPSNDPWMFASYIFFVHVSNKLSFCNSSVNVFLYCMGGAKFRQEALTLITCGKFGGGPSTFSTSMTEDDKSNITNTEPPKKRNNNCNENTV